MTQQKKVIKGFVPSVGRVHVEHYSSDVLGIGTGTPRLSWTYGENVSLPDGAQVVIQAIRDLPGHEITIEEVYVKADENVLHEWPFAPAQTHEHVTVNVRPAIGIDHKNADYKADFGNADGIQRISKETGSADSTLSHVMFHSTRRDVENVRNATSAENIGKVASVSFEPGVLHHWQWRAAMVGPAWPELWSDGRHPPLIRGDAHLKNEPLSARLYVSAYGLYEPWINGKRISEDVLTPGWVDYDDRLPYRTYDVTPYLRQGRNAFGFQLADGWYRGRYGYAGGVVNYYGDRLGIYAQINVVFADGSTQQIVSNAYDGCWRAKKGPIVSSGLYEGECYDARLYDPHWCDPCVPPDESWQLVTELAFDQLKLVALEQQPIRCVAHHRPIDIRKRADGSFIVDFGQNCSQRIRLSIPQTDLGRVIEIQHAEVLDEQGNLALRPLRREGIQKDIYICDGQAAVWEPTFTMHGFRYAEICGWPESELTSDDLVACAYTTDMERKGWFSCSSQDLNRLHENIIWSMRSNFLSFPMDCPQRDERLGWTGDIAVFSPTAMRLCGAGGFLSDWLDDVDGEIKRYGTVPPFVPFITIPDWRKADAIAIWGDSAVLVPWAIYQEEGDVYRLAKHYPAACAWMNDVERRLSDDGVWWAEPDQVCGQFGDWLDPNAPADHPEQAMTEKPLVVTAFAAHSAELVSKMASILGFDADALRYKSLSNRIRAGFCKAFVRTHGLMTSDTECAYTLAIVFGLCSEDPEWMEAAGNRLAQLVVQGEYHVGTGFAGTPFLLQALTITGHEQEAFRVLTCRSCPSWLYQVRMGATTTWERWDSIRPDGSINTSGMTSFNHYWLGVVAEWMHSVLGGLRMLKPGWGAFAVEPHPGGGVTSAHVAYESPYGRIELKWEIREGRLHMSFNVPTGSKARVNVNGQRTWLNPGQYNFAV